ncbi:heme NO-binding domain-containing protein [Tropicimonas sp.]|uniref:heme NO-binding domain-containing protein n=1 Tax=Tropicimonas sp. TaxID=2067044 RepID=UPI003A8A64FD
MHGLINNSIQCFLRDTYGQRAWAEIALFAGVGVEGFEAMLVYDESQTVRLLDEAARMLDKPGDMILEDLGTYLVSHPNAESIRRLLRFGGEGFFDFLQSLEDLPGRARLAVAELILPDLELLDGPDGRFTIVVRGGHPGFSCVLVGVLRAMADDYGALVLLDLRRVAPGRQEIDVVLLDTSFAEGRSFCLACPATGGDGDER